MRLFLPGGGALPIFKSGIGGLGLSSSADLSAACSSGEEVYSICMLLHELLPGRNNWSVLGSDLCRHALDSARSGIYPMSRAQGIPPAYLKRYCLKGIGELDGLLQVRPELQNNVSFRCINLNSPLPTDLPTFDLIFYGTF